MNNDIREEVVQTIISRRYISQEKVIELIVITVFQIVFAVAITLYVNYQISNIQNKLNIELREKQKMEETASQFNSLSHGRLFLMNRLINHYKSPSDPKDRDKFRNEYTDSINLWNSSRGNLEAGIELYFGKENVVLYQEKIDKSFRDIHQRFYDCVQKNKDDKKSTENFTIELKNLEPEIKKLTQSIYELDKNMQTKIKSVVSKID